MSKLTEDGVFITTRPELEMVFEKNEKGEIISISYRPTGLTIHDYQEVSFKDFKGCDEHK